jgi:hypothetical protein
VIAGSKRRTPTPPSFNPLIYYHYQLAILKFSCSQVFLLYCILYNYLGMLAWPSTGIRPSHSGNLLEVIRPALRRLRPALGAKCSSRFSGLICQIICERQRSA